MSEIRGVRIIDERTAELILEEWSQDTRPSPTPVVGILPDGRTVIYYGMDETGLVKLLEADGARRLDVTMGG